jgi:hypothetical protein
MRQGGMRPKGHNSGTYWVRANANSGGGKTKNSISSNNEDFSGVIEGITSDRTTIICKVIGRIVGLILAVFLIFIGITHSP